MKRYILILLVHPLFLLSCFSDDSEDTVTVFEGVVLYSDDLEPVTNANLNFLGLKAVPGIGQLDETILERDIPLSENGSFRFELEVTKSNIDYFGVRLFSGDNPIGISCEPYSCASLTPRTVITDMQFLAERE